MKTFARIQDGWVREVIVADELPEFTPEVTAMFVEAPEGVEQHWRFDGANWTPPPPYPAE